MPLAQDSLTIPRAGLETFASYPSGKRLVHFIPEGDSKTGNSPGQGNPGTTMRGVPAAPRHRHEAPRIRRASSDKKTHSSEFALDEIMNPK
jgi:hypothetical protein